MSVRADVIQELQGMFKDGDATPSRLIQHIADLSLWGEVSLHGLIQEYFTGGIRRSGLFVA